MKNLLTLLIALGLSMLSSAQNGIYVYGFMENAPEEPVLVDLTVYSDSALTWATLITSPSGDIETQFIQLPDGAEFQAIESTFIDCNGTYVSDFTFASNFPNSVDIPLFLQYCSDSLAYGCTDPLATNYDPQANIDNGSCIYPSTCELNDVVLNMTTSAWGYEISWTLSTDNTVVATGSGYQSNANYSSAYCLEDGCYTLEMMDSFGDGWNGGVLEILIDGVQFNSITLVDGSFGLYTFGINQDSCEVAIAGCTDPEAENYNPDATIDDESCTYPPYTPNDLCSDATPILPGVIAIDNSQASINEGIWGECWGFGSGEGEQTSVWYSFTTPAEPASIHFEAIYDGTNTLTDTQFGLFETCGGEMIYCDGNSGEGLMSAFDFACGELEENTTYILMIDGWNGDAGTCLLNFSVDTLCGTAILGCTDPAALNYNANATEDDGSCQYDSGCTENLITVVINTEIWGNEISWNIVNSEQLEVVGGGGYASNSTYASNWCMPDGCYAFEMFDSFGDGWNGGTFEIWQDSAMIAYGTLETGNFGSISFGINSADCDSILPIYGCTDPEASNYNPLANSDDGSCIYDEECTNVSIFLEGNTPFTASWVLYSNQGYITTGFVNEGFMATDLCLPDGCYTFELFGDSTLTYETYFSAWSANEMIAGQTLLPYDAVSFGIGAGCDTLELIYGCTDPEAINYNPLANTDDGSCNYQFDCSIDFLVVPDSSGADIIWIIPSANIFNATSVLWDFGDGTTSTELFPQHEYTGDGPYTLCLTAFFETANGSTCSITFCIVLTGDMVGGSGFAGSSGFSINVINGEAPLSANGANPLEAILFWPNPAVNELNIGNISTTVSDVQIDIVDITGKVVSQHEIGQNSKGTNPRIEVSTLANGIYLLRLSADGLQHTERFVIAR